MKEFENINESFSFIGKELPFEVPVDYFERLPMRIQKQCVQPQTAKGLHVPFLTVLRSQLSLAAGFIGMAMLALAGYYFIRPSEPLNTAKSDYIEIVQKNIYEGEMGRKNEVNNKDSNDSLKNNLRDEMFKYLIEDNGDYVTLMEKY